MTTRSEKTREAIKDAILELLEDKSLDRITMSELAAVANVSRSTLYSHYANIREVFDECVMDFCKGLRSLDSYLRCGVCLSETDNSARPFCVALREAGKYSTLVQDPSFLPTVLDFVSNKYADSFQDVATKNAQRILSRFQMSGCYYVAMDSMNDDWESTQKLLDTYICAGMHAVRTV